MDPDQTFPVVDRDLYRVDGVITEEFTPAGAPPYDHEMVCFSLPKWYDTLTINGPTCS